MKQRRSLTGTTALAVALLALLVGCVGSGTEPDIPPDLDTYEGLSNAIVTGEDILIYDVRSREEFETGHIPGAINVPHTEIADALPTDYQNKIIVVYCRSGGRSRMAYEALTAEGFKYVVDFGGINGWLGELSYDCGCPE